PRGPGAGRAAERAGQAPGRSRAAGAEGPAGASPLVIIPSSGFRTGPARLIVEGGGSQPGEFREPMTRRYDVRTGMVDEDPDAGQPREELVPGWHVPGRTRYDYDLRIGDAERDVAMAQLREHFVAGRLTFDELSERIDFALTA